VVKHANAVEASIVLVEVLAAAADAVIVVHQLPKFGDHPFTARPVEEIA
jgi:hypothetical protein